MGVGFVVFGFLIILTAILSMGRVGRDIIYPVTEATLLATLAVLVIALAYLISISVKNVAVRGEPRRIEPRDPGFFPPMWADIRNSSSLLSFGFVVFLFSILTIHGGFRGHVPGGFIALVAVAVSLTSLASFGCIILGLIGIAAHIGMLVGHQYHRYQNRRGWSH